MWGIVCHHAEREAGRFILSTLYALLLGDLLDIDALATRSSALPVARAAHDMLTLLCDAEPAILQRVVLHIIAQARQARGLGRVRQVTRALQLLGRNLFRAAAWQAVGHVIARVPGALRSRQPGGSGAFVS